LVVITMNHVHALVFGAAILSGSFGAFMLTAFVWFPIAGTIKMEREIVMPVRLAIRRNQMHIDIDGVPVKVTPVADSTGELAVGMSMGDS